MSQEFQYGMDPDDMPDTPDRRRTLNAMRFDLWKHEGIKPEEVGDAADAYAQYLKTGEVSDKKLNGF